jgi:phosphoenolpyruvate carboxylase
MSREADRQQLPAPMRRDVRLLGGLLGEAIRDIGGQDLLDDVERLRRAVIAARARTEPADGAAAGEIAALVAGWPPERAELVAKAFTVYFHLTNVAEERQRVRTLRGQAPGEGPRRESLAAAVAELSAEPDGHRLDDLLGRLRVHPVLTAHPTEARRRAVATALRRIAGLVDALDEERGPAGHAEARRRLREEIELLWLTAPLRVKPIGPVDEVRTVMAVFDETLFTLAPVMYRALDDACRGQRGGGRAGPPVAPAFLRFGSWVGADRDGNPLVTAQVTREAAVIQADHALRALENATSRIGRALTVHAEAAPAGPGSRSPSRPPRRTTPSCWRAWPGAHRRSHTGRTCSTWRNGCARRACARPTWPTPAARNSWPTCGSCRTPWPEPVPPARRSASCRT